MKKNRKKNQKTKMGKKKRKKISWNHIKKNKEG